MMIDETQTCKHCLVPLDERHWWQPGAGCFHPSYRIPRKDYVVKVDGELLIEKEGKLKIEETD